MNMELSEKIGEGHHRECFAVDGENLIVKKLKRKKQRSCFLKKLLPVRNVNAEEFQLYKSLPGSLKEYLPSYMEMKDDILIMERITDYDGNFSKTVLEYGRIENDNFWEETERIARILTEEKVWMFDIFHHGNNIVVKKISEDTFIPVLIDFKRVGWRAYPLQLNLLFEKEKRKKFRRRFGSFLKRYRA